MIELLPLSLDDARAVAEGGRDDGWAEDFPTPGDSLVAGFLVRRGVNDPPWCHYRVVEVGSGLVVGGAGIKTPPGENGEVEVGYGIVPSRQRRGYATEAVRRLCATAFGAGAGAVIADTDDGNVASQRVLEKLDFVRVAGAAEGQQRFRLTAG